MAKQLESVYERVLECTKKAFLLKEHRRYNGLYLSRRRYAICKAAEKLSLYRFSNVNLNIKKITGIYPLFFYQRLVDVNQREGQIMASKKKVHL